MRRAVGDAGDGTPAADAEARVELEAPAEQSDSPMSASRPRGSGMFRLTKKRIALGAVLALFLALGFLYTQKDAISPKVADFSRNVIGDENTARVESYYFQVQDRIDQLKYKVFGGSTNPFQTGVARVEFVPRAEPRRVVVFAGSDSRSAGSVLTADTLGPAPLQLPRTVALRDSLEAGEGVWSTAGLPRTTANDILMAKTFIRPDKTRPYALVGVLLVDSRRVRLNMSAGTVDPGGFRGVKGTGTIPVEKQPTLLAAWNGGFKGAHGNFGMYADGKEYVPLRSGLASIAVLKDGTIKMGEWGKDLQWDDAMVAVRQNAVLLVQNGEVSRRVSEGNDTWGYVQVNSAEFITWRSAVGLTKDGHLIVAAGNSLSAETLAKALWAAGAYTAMQLDINSPYVLLSDFFPQPDGSLKAERFMENMPDSPMRFLRSQERDFMYVTLDESRYRN